MKTKTTDQWEVRGGNIAPLIVETRDQLDRFMEAAGELPNVKVRHRTTTVTTTDWTDYGVDDTSGTGH